MIELQVDGGDWLDIEWTSAGYDGVLTDAAGNPSGSLSVFGQQCRWPEQELLVLVLGESLAGRDVSMRFRIGTDQQRVMWAGRSRRSMCWDWPRHRSRFWPRNRMCNPPCGRCRWIIRRRRCMGGTRCGSFDPVGEALTHVWTASGGVSVEDADTACGFVAPDVDVETVITVTLTVDDGAQQDSDQVDVFVLPGDVDEEDTHRRLAPQQRPSGCACSSTGHRPVSAMVWLWVIVCWGGRRRMGS